MMRIDVCHSLTGELLDIELPEGALVEELRNALKVRIVQDGFLLCAITPMLTTKALVQKQTGVEIESQVL
jgi:hypothetical protein